MSGGSEFARGPIQDAMTESFNRFGGRRAVVGAASAFSYSDLHDQVKAGAEQFRLLIPGPRRHVGFCLKNCPEYITYYFATLFAGYLPLLLDANFNNSEIEAIRDDCGLDALVLDARKAERLEVPRDGDATVLDGDVVLLRLEKCAEPRFEPRNDTQACRFTSGTTGRPKCLEFSGQAVVSAARNWVSGTGMESADRTLCLAALSNGLAFNTSLLPTFLAGAEIHFHKGLPLTRPVSRRIEASAITCLVAFPTLYRNFVAPDGPGRSAMASLKRAISAGAPLWGDVREEFRSRYGLDISDYYGIAETGPCTFELEKHYHQGLGRPLPGVEIRIAVDEDQATGEVLVKTESMASGYLNHPGLLEDRVDAEGFYHSGDRGRIENGRLHLTGRTEDHINVAGRKIDPTEILAVVLDLDSVSDAVVFPDEDLNRETVVHLVAVPAMPDLEKQELAGACRSRLAGYKTPGRISFVNEIPRTGIGKPRIAVLREQLNLGESANRGESPTTSPAPAGKETA